MKIRAAVLYETKNPFVVETIDLEKPRAGEVLIKVAATGVCHSDWHLVTGATPHPMPVAVGHEGSGVVEDVGDGVTRVKTGDHVSLNWAPSCGSCFYCFNGRPSLCATYVGPLWAGTMLDGTTRLSRKGQRIFHFSGLACFAEFAVVPQECCVTIDKKVPMAVAALIGCAVTTGVGSVINTAKVTPGSSVAVFGAGGVGLSTILGAKYAGAERIIAVDRSKGKRRIALNCGATEFFLNDETTVYNIRQLTGGRGADYVFEAVGIPALQEKCLEALRPGGTLVLSGISPVGSTTNFPGAVITRQEKTIMGSYYGTADTGRDFPKYADLYMKNKLDLDRLISKTYSLDQINEAYADMLSGEKARSIVLL